MTLKLQCLWTTWWSQRNVNSDRTTTGINNGDDDNKNEENEVNFTDDELSIAPEADTPSMNTKAWGIQATADTYSFGVGYFDFYCRAAASRIKRRGNLVTVRAVFSPPPPPLPHPTMPPPPFLSVPTQKTNDNNASGTRKKLQPRANRGRYMRTMPCYW